MGIIAFQNTTVFSDDFQADVRIAVSDAGVADFTPEAVAFSRLHFNGLTAVGVSVGFRVEVGISQAARAGKMNGGVQFPVRGRNRPCKGFSLCIPLFKRGIPDKIFCRSCRQKQQKEEKGRQQHFHILFSFINANARGRSCLFYRLIL